ncbi:hypothetical protein ACLX1H_009260 [Fusarium chlamydosporum]
MSRLLTRRLTPLFRLTPTTTRFASSFQSRPAPPKLPAEQQAEFERLQRAASVSSAFQPTEETATSAAGPTTPATSQVRHTTIPEKKTDDEMNVGYFRGAPPEFEGDVNPKTGEVGGPKNEPLRWGGQK